MKQLDILWHAVSHFVMNVLDDSITVGFNDILKKKKLPKQYYKKKHV